MVCGLVLVAALVLWLMYRQWSSKDGARRRVADQFSSNETSPAPSPPSQRRGHGWGPDQAPAYNNSEVVRYMQMLRLPTQMQSGFGSERATHSHFSKPPVHSPNSASSLLLSPVYHTDVPGDYVDVEAADETALDDVNIRDLMPGELPEEEERRSPLLSSDLVSRQHSAPITTTVGRAFSGSQGGIALGTPPDTLLSSAATNDAAQEHVPTPPAYRGRRGQAARELPPQQDVPLHHRLPRGESVPHQQTSMSPSWLDRHLDSIEKDSGTFQGMKVAIPGGSQAGSTARLAPPTGTSTASMPAKLSRPASQGPTVPAVEGASRGQNTGSRLSRPLQPPPRIKSVPQKRSYLVGPQNNDDNPILDFSEFEDPALHGAFSNTSLDVKNAPSIIQQEPPRTAAPASVGNLSRPRTEPHSAARTLTLAAPLRQDTEVVQSLVMQSLALAGAADLEHISASVKDDYDEDDENESEELVIM